MRGADVATTDDAQRHPQPLPRCAFDLQWRRRGAVRPSYDVCRDYHGSELRLSAGGCTMNCGKPQKGAHDGFAANCGWHPSRMTAFPSTPCQVRRRLGPLDRQHRCGVEFSASEPTRHLLEHWHDIPRTAGLASLEYAVLLTDLARQGAVAFFSVVEARWQCLTVDATGNIACSLGHVGVCGHALSGACRGREQTPN